MSKVLFIGGTGQISLACVNEAVAQGHKVSVFNRGHVRAKLPAGVTSILGDMKNSASYGELAGEAFDVICQFMAYTPQEMETDLKLFSGKTGQYIFISSASVYEKPSRHYVITEKTPTVNPYWAYSQQKIACESLVKQSAGLAWTIVRPSHTVRTKIPSMVGDGDGFAQRLLEGKPVIAAGDGNAPWTLTRSEDFAKPFVGLFGKSGAMGEDFHITSDRGHTWDAIYKAIARGLGVEAKIVHVPTETLVRYNFEWQGPLSGDKSWTALFDNSKVKAVAGDFSCAEDLDVILANSLMNFRARMAANGAPRPGANEALMDRIASAQSALG